MSGVHALTMPKWGLSMTEGQLGRWLVGEGVEVGAGIELVEIETDKIIGVLEAPTPGVLRRKVARESNMVPVGGLLGILADASVRDADIDAYIADFQAHFVPAVESGPSSAGSEIAQVDGFALRYRKLGDAGDAAVLIHGFGGDLNTWLFNHEEFAATRTVYALDLPGHGGSSKQIETGALAEFAKVLGGFMDRVGLDRAHLAGHSMGGAVALEFALAYPERARSICLIASAGLGPEIDGEYIEGFITARRRRELQPQIEKLFANPKSVSRQLVEDILKYKRVDGVEPTLRTIADQFCPGGRQALVRRKQLASLTVPVLVLWGAEDRILPPSHALDLPTTVRTEILAGGGHMVQMEEASKVNRLVRSFWDSVQPYPRASQVRASPSV
jgi:pyruvate dehydrogenase E2 component (dihydrolipoamide acetyltransferase)